MPEITFKHHIAAAITSAALAAMIFATPVAHADEPTSPTATESTSTADPTSTSTAEQTSTATSEPTATETAEPTKTETEKPAATATVTVTKTETPAPPTTVRPGKDDPVVDPCEWTDEYRPATCPTVRPTVTVAPR